MTAEAGVVGIFSRLLPWVPASVGSKYGEEMCAYHAAFTKFRVGAMNYEGDPEYLNTQTTIMEVPKDQCWPFCPNFRKCVCLTLQELFKTKIVSFSMSPVSLDQHMVFVDESANRWIMSVVKSPLDPEGMNVVYMHFPRSNTPICKCVSTTELVALNAMSFGLSGQNLVVSNTACWNAGAGAPGV